MHSFSKLLYSTMCAGTLSCMAGAAALVAQELITYSFTAEVVEITDEHDALDVDVAVGDEITGVLMFDPNISIQDGNARYSEFDLGLSGTSRFVVLAGDHEFEDMVQQGGSGFREVGLFGEMQSSEGHVVDENGNLIDYYCHSSLSIVSEFSEHSNGDPVLEHSSNMNLQFDHNVCDNPLDISSLPRTIELDDWNSATLGISTFDSNEGHYSLNAKITGISSNETAGAKVSGKIFSDYNGDCQVNGLDAGLSRRIVKFTPGSFLAATDQAGDYNITLPVGDYDVEVVERPLWKVGCVNGSTTVSLPNAEAEATVDFGMEPE